MRGVFRKRLSALHPEDEDAKGMMRHLPNDVPIIVEIKRPRNLKHLRLYWALMQLVFENLPYELHEQWLVRSKENLSDIAKIAVGHFTLEFLPADDTLRNFSMRPIPKSISYKEMSQDDFSQFFDKVVEWVIRDVIPGTEKDELLDQVTQMVGG